MRIERVGRSNLRPRSQRGRHRPRNGHGYRWRQLPIRVVLAHGGPGQQIQLTAIPASGYEFSSWSGGQCAAQGSPCTFTINSGQTVTASFTKLPDAPGGPPSTPPTPVQPPTPTPPAELQAIVSLGSLIASVNKHLARVEIDCRKSQLTCSGTLTLTVKVAKTPRRKAHTLTLGSARFSVTAGKRAALDVHLTTTAGALLNADHGRLHAAATLALQA
jgi:hypothetical protein